MGLLRNGALIAQDSPSRILQKFDCENLDTAFLKLCKNQEANMLVEHLYSEIDEILKTDHHEPSKNENLAITKTSLIKARNVKAMIRKNFLQTFRRPAWVEIKNFVFFLLRLEFFSDSSLSFLLLTPFICLVTFYLCIGSNPIGLKIGIVNFETDHHSECEDPLLKMTTVIDYTCRVNKVSCRFINSLQDSTAKKVFYASFEDALEDVKRGIIVGLINFSSNFTSSMKPLNGLEELLEEHLTDGEIKIFLDQSDLQITGFLQQRLYETFEEFIENLMMDCGKSKRVGSLPMQINTMFGSLSDEPRRSMTPGILISFYFFLASMLTSSAFVSDRLDGIWNRILLADVKSSEVLASHIITNVFTLLLFSIEFIVITKYIYELENHGSEMLACFMILLVGLAAISYGLAVSVLANDYMTATFASSVIFFPMMIMCGEKF